MGVFTIQLNHAIRTFGEQSKTACGLSEEEEKLFLQAKVILTKKDISLEFLAKLKEQLSGYIATLTKDLSPESSIKVQLTLLISNFLNRENILNKNFLNSIEDAEVIELLIPAFGMLFTEMTLETQYHDAYCRLLLNAIRDPQKFYDPRRALSLYEIAMKLNEFKGFISGFAIGVPEFLENIIHDNQRKFFIKGIRINLITLDKLPDSIEGHIESLHLLAKTQPHPENALQRAEYLAQEILVEAKKFRENPEIKAPEGASNFISKIDLLYKNAKISRWGDFLNKYSQAQDQKLTKIYSPKPPSANRNENLASISSSPHSSSGSSSVSAVAASSNSLSSSSSSNLVSHSGASGESQTCSAVSSASAPSVAALPLVPLPVSGDLSSSVSASSPSSNSELQSSISDSSAPSEKLVSLEQPAEGALQDLNQAPKSLSLNSPSSASSSASLVAQPAASPLSSQPLLPKPIVPGSKLQQRLSIFENKESESPQPQKQDPKRRQGSLFSAERLAAASSGIKAPSLGGGS